MQQQQDNVVRLADYRQEHDPRQEQIDNLNARAFMFLRDGAVEESLPLGEVFAEHLLGLALIIQRVEGTQRAQALLRAVENSLAESSNQLKP